MFRFQGAEGIARGQRAQRVGDDRLRRIPATLV